MIVPPADPEEEKTMVLESEFNPRLACSCGLPNQSLA